MLKCSPVWPKGREGLVGDPSARKNSTGKERAGALGTETSQNRDMQAPLCFHNYQLKTDLEWEPSGLRYLTWILQFSIPHVFWGYSISYAVQGSYLEIKFYI